jgi:hypothetical protein
MSRSISTRRRPPSWIACQADGRQAIVDYRAVHGLFTAIEQLLNVPGIGPNTYQALEGLITV